jgi:ribA/ribD-fused uncharacterized protein
MINEFDKDFAFLSNFYPSPFEEFGILFPTVEHYFQAMKAIHFDDMVMIAKTTTPGKAKYMGRHINMRSDWEEIKVDVMRHALERKFENPELRAKLLSTGETPLVEGNWWHDNTWGDCQCERCSRTLGHNLLGKLLMDLRTRIKEQLGN